MRSETLTEKQRTRIFTLQSHMGDAHCDGIDHPPPSYDPPCHYIRDEEICGFTSMADLRKWFWGYLTELKRCGFKIVTYDVPAQNVTILEHQVVFTK